jgi:hypothetical protein
VTRTLGIYIDETRRILGKIYGIKKRGAIGNVLREHIENLGNPLGIHWKLERNILGTK